MNLMLLPYDKSEPGPPAKKRKGPPNRMNDLPYREWMKFQKSFFRHESDEILVQQCVEFFTKAKWPDGKASQSLIGGFSPDCSASIGAHRIVDDIGKIEELDDLITILQERAKACARYDFALLDFRAVLQSGKEVRAFLRKYADKLFDLLRQVLRPERYCGLIVSDSRDCTVVPIAWMVSVASRKHLKLRDEKIALMKTQDEVYYCLFMQAADDANERDSSVLSSIRKAPIRTVMPAWVVPKPPPRKRNEILHPAKFPETLVEQFIELFTKPGESVFDPMVGTGSTVIAALRLGRSACGIELSPEWAGIAKKRLLAEFGGRLFESAVEQPAMCVILANACAIDTLTELRGRRFDYAITSPPYWSMLQNRGSEYQRGRRKRELSTVYSASNEDLGNIEGYDRFLDALQAVYEKVAMLLRPGALFTIIVKNVKREHTIYPLAWDIVAKLCGKSKMYDYVGNTFWCQDDVGLKPFAVGIHWVSNTLHHYCLHLRRKKGL